MPNAPEMISSDWRFDHRRARQECTQIFDDLEDRQRPVGKRDPRDASVLHVAAVDDAHDPPPRRSRSAFHERLDDAQSALSSMIESASIEQNSG
jgi:hypothetical protein